MTIQSTNYTPAMENALLTAENHGKAYVLRKTMPVACRDELLRELRQHHIGYQVSSHARITPMQAETIADDMIHQWAADDSNNAPDSWTWMMTYCRENGLPPAQAWAWRDAELAYQEAHEPLK